MEDQLALLEELKQVVTELEGKVDELYMRPRMPYSQTGSVGDLLRLDANLQPYWTT